MNKTDTTFIFLTIFLAFVVLFTGCTLGNDNDVQPTATPIDLSVDTLIIGYSEPFTTLNPFFADTTTNVDMDIVNLTQIFLLDIDDIKGVQINSGNYATIEMVSAPTLAPTQPEITPILPETSPISSASPVETVAPAVPTSIAGDTVYKITLRENLYTADGKKLDVDDLIFNMYIMCDTSYDGAYLFGQLPIKGIDEYRYGYNQDVFTKYAQVALNIIEVSPETEDLTPYLGIFTEEQFNNFWKLDFETGCAEYLDEIINHVNASRIDSETSPMSGVALAMYKCGLAQVTEDGKLVDVCMKEYDMNVALPTEEDFIACLKHKYQYDIKGIEKMYAEVSFTDILLENFVVREARLGGDITESNNRITGIKRIDEFTVEVTLASQNVTDWLYFVFPVMPMEYYGSSDFYNYEENQFGFTKGDISKIREDEKYPLGAGPYKYEQTADGMIYLVKNSFYAGENMPDISTVIFYLNEEESQKYSDPMLGIIDGSYDICMLFEANSQYNTVMENDSIGVRAATGYKLIFSKERIEEGSMPEEVSDFTTWLRKISAVKMK